MYGRQALACGHVRQIKLTDILTLNAHILQAPSRVSFMISSVVRPPVAVPRMRANRLGLVCGVPTRRR